MSNLCSFRTKRIRIILGGGCYRDSGKHGDYHVVYWDFMGIMENKTEIAKMLVS